MSSSPKIRVLIVDDSSLVRRALTDVLADEKTIEVVGAASDAYDARDKILELRPDVLTLDLDMPRMDGLSFLRTLQMHRPMPVVVVSSVSPQGSRNALDAIAAGALEIVPKPAAGQPIALIQEQLIYSIQAAASAKLNLPVPPAMNSSAVYAEESIGHQGRLILIGASTGGTEAIREVLSALPDGLPGICIVQHIPAVFSNAFASRLNECCRFPVREARHGDVIHPGLALVAPGDFHMAVEMEGGRPCIRLEKGPALHFTRPAVDILFNSAAAWIGAGSVAVLLSGMGSDGACGMKNLHQRGVCTLAQDKNSSAVYGMPKAAVDLGAVDHVLPLRQIPGGILAGLRAQDRRGQVAPVPLCQ